MNRAKEVEMGAATQGNTAKAMTEAKLPWEPMRLVAVGTVAALLEGATGSRNDGAMGNPNMMVGAA